MWHFSANLLLPTNILHMPVCSTRKLLPSQYIDIPRDMSWQQLGRLLEKECQANEGEVTRFWCLSSSSVDVDAYKHACLWKKVTTVSPSYSHSLISMENMDGRRHGEPPLRRINQRHIILAQLLTEEGRPLVFANTQAKG